MNYKQAHDKIIEAYFKDEIKPASCEFCFCGTLAPNSQWHDKYSKGYYPYSYFEYFEMERALLSKLSDVIRIGDGCSEYSFGYSFGRHDNYEDELFEGMCAALDVLKEIHRSRGENVDEEIQQFSKRELKQTI